MNLGCVDWLFYRTLALIIGLLEKQKHRKRIPDLHQTGELCSFSPAKVHLSLLSYFSSPSPF